MSDFADYIICEYCDSVYQRPSLTYHQRAHCLRCGAVVNRPPLLSIDQLLALSVTAAMLLAFLVFYPILLLRVQGQVNSATLLDSALALFQGPMSLMGLTVAFSILLIPAVQVLLLLWVLTFARRRRKAPGFAIAMRILATLRPWGMLEVFLLGSLVAVFKMTGRLEVVPVAGLFALAALSILMIAVAGRDIRLLWEQLT